ncbi:uncharacterized protein BJ212DRAFT_1484427 [Suillus subaureus]|uniref:Uncharacterized protein n=1 Tax=Suillus subaureus TaxID=48587 RepID=A0A9P7E2K0_9AGAM|nr:uncharacterized protein BJ212DRAFT_1484427 [Suillus subaureus]KAG1809304.1 hypothetical protein BJ212DRAFT_1484427 [Suillus subaureus]
MDPDTDMESDLEPPPSMQVPRGYYDADICQAAALARTQTSHSTMTSDALLEDDLIEDNFMVNDNFTDNHAFAIEEDAPSSDIEFVNHIKPVVVKTKSEPVSLRVTSAVTNVGIKHRAPVAKRTKSSITHTHSLSSISSATSGAMLKSVEVEILPCSAYRIKNLLEVLGQSLGGAQSSFLPSFPPLGIKTKFGADSSWR